MKVSPVSTALSGVVSISYADDMSLAYRRFVLGSDVCNMGVLNPFTGDMKDLVFSIRGGVAASPSNPKKIAVSEGRNLVLLLTDQGRELTHPLLGAAHETEGTLSWSPEGNHLAAIGYQEKNTTRPRLVSTLCIFDQDLKLVKMIESGNWLSQLSWKADGQVISYVEVEHTITNFMSLTGAHIPPKTDVVDFTFSPTGNCCTYRQIDSATKSRLILEVAGEEPIVLASYNMVQNKYPYDWLKWSPDGKHFVFNAGRFSPGEIMIYSLDQRRITRWVDTKSANRYDSPTWRKDSKAFALVTKVSGGGIRLFELA